MNKNIFFTVFFSCTALVALEPGPVSITWGYSAQQGHRAHMEDFHSVEVPLTEDNAFFAIYDGHGGATVSTFLSQALHWRLARSLLLRHDVEESIVAAFEEQDKSFTFFKNMGSTAVVAYLDQRDTSDLHLAWVGDSRAIVIEDGLLVEETIDHKPTAESEKRRLMELNAPVSRGRMGGRLAVSRAFGDFFYKDEKNSGVIAFPSLKKIPAKPGQTIILASDGLWDVLTSEDVAVYAQMQVAHEYVFDARCDVRTGDEKLSLFANRLRSVAHGLGSHDNISVLVVQFDAVACKNAVTTMPPVSKDAPTEMQPDSKDVPTEPTPDANDVPKVASPDPKVS